MNYVVDGGFDMRRKLFILGTGADELAASLERAWAAKITVYADVRSSSSVTKAV